MSAPAADTGTARMLELADDELIIGWRESEWTGVAPYLEEDVALSSIAQNEIGHARALYQVAAAELGTGADELAFDRPPDQYLSCPLVELRLMEWDQAIARRILYELADEVRIGALIASDAEPLAGIARKIDREEVYHRIHARMWAERLLASDAGRDRLLGASRALWPLALGMLHPALREPFREHALALLGPEAEGDPVGPGVERGVHTPELEPLWDEMTMVRRTAPGARW